MPARIAVIVDGRQEKVFWIASEVVRVGGDASCQLAVPRAPKHAATVQFRQGRYLILNRGDRPLEIEGHAVAPGANVIWDDGAEVVLPGGAVLRLELLGDNPAPAPAPVERAEPQWEPEFAEPPDDRSIETSFTAEAPPQPSMSPAKIKNAIQLTVTLLCLVAVVVLLLFKDQIKNRAGGGEAVRQVPPFGKVVEELVKAEAAGAVPGDVRLRIQEGRRYESEERWTNALGAYAAARDLLVRQAAQRDPIRFPDDSPEDHAYQYLMDKIRMLEKK